MGLNGSSFISKRERNGGEERFWFERGGGTWSGHDPVAASEVKGHLIGFRSLILSNS